MSRDGLVEFLEGFHNALFDLFDETIDEIEYSEVTQRLRKIRDDMYHTILDLIEDVEEEG